MVAAFTPSATVTRVSNNSVSNSSTSKSGGGIYDSAGTVFLINSTLSKNTATASAGGGTWAGNGASLSNSQVNSNTAGSAGDILHKRAMPTLTANKPGQQQRNGWQRWQRRLRRGRVRHRQQQQCFRQHRQNRGGRRHLYRHRITLATMQVGNRAQAGDGGNLYTVDVSVTSSTVKGTAARFGQRHR